MIWKYNVPTQGGKMMAAYGTPVEVFIPGIGFMQVVYQFGTNTQRCAVVHWQSGAILAGIEEWHTGYPQERARAAIAEKLSGVTEKRTVAVLTGAKVINSAPVVVGSM